MPKLGAHALGLSQARMAARVAEVAHRAVPLPTVRLLGSRASRQGHTVGTGVPST